MPRVQRTSEKDAPGAVQSVLLALGILETLALRGAAGVTEIAQALATPKARVHRHLRTLVQAGYAAQQAEGERYAPGSRLLALATAAAGEEALIAIALPVMERLRDRLGHSVNLSRATPQDVNIIASLTGTSVVGVTVRPNASLALHASAGGKIALAFADPDRRPKLKSGKLEVLTPHTIADPKALDNEIARVREQGWAGAPEELILGINAVAAPVWGRDRRLVGSLTLLNSIQFLGARPAPAHIEALIVAADEISGILSLRLSGEPRRK